MWSFLIFPLIPSEVQPMSYRQAPHRAIFRSSLYGSWYLYGKWCRVHISMLHKNVRKSLSITANMILLSVTICGTMGTSSNASIGHKQHVMSPYLCSFWKKRGSPHRHFVCLLIWSRYTFSSVVCYNGLPCGGRFGQIWKNFSGMRLSPWPMPKPAYSKSSNATMIEWSLRFFHFE